MFAVTRHLRRAAALRGREVGVVSPAGRWTWGEVERRVAGLAAGFRAAGLVPGDRVAVLSANTHRIIEATYAAPWAGGTFAPLNWRLSDAELAEVLADADPAILLVSPEQAPRVAALRAAAPSLRIVVDDAAHEAMAAGPGTEDAEPSGDDLAAIYWTGGTTGRPKGVMLSHGNLGANALTSVHVLEMNERTVHLVAQPLFHLAGGARITATTLAMGRHVVPAPRFDADDVADTILREGVTHAAFVPTMISTLLDRRAADLRSLRLLAYGSAPMPEALLRRAIAAWPAARFVQSYGMTELSPLATALLPEDHDPDGPGAHRLRSAGRAVFNAEVRIGDPDGAPLPVGEVGEVLVRGPIVMRGYWRQPGATAAAIRDGWMRTGDAGRLDEDGYLTVVDRLKDMIVTGGENVYSAEVENALHLHPAIEECAVIGRPDPHWGEAVHAVVVPRAGASVDEASLRAHCRTLIAGFKVPRSFDIRDAPLPRSGAGKILKSALRRAPEDATA